MFYARSLFRITLVITLLFIVLAGSVQATFANGAFTDTITWKNETITFEAYGSCSDPDGLYQITIVSSGTIHIVENANGYKFKWSEHGTYFLEPIDASSPVTYSGYYADHLIDTGIFTDGKFAFNRTFINIGQGSDGTHETFRFTNIWIVTPNGVKNERESGFQWICN